MNEQPRIAIVGSGEDIEAALQKLSAEMGIEAEVLALELNHNAARLDMRRHEAMNFAEAFIRESMKGYGTGGARQFGKALERLGTVRPKPQPPRKLTAEERKARYKKLKSKKAGK